MLGLNLELPLSIQLVLSDAQETRCGRSWAILPHYSHPDTARGGTKGGLSRHSEVESNDEGDRENSVQGNRKAIVSFHSPLNKLIRSTVMAMRVLHNIIYPHDIIEVSNHPPSNIFSVNTATPGLIWSSTQCPPLRVLLWVKRQRVSLLE